MLRLRVAALGAAAVAARGPSRPAVRAASRELAARSPLLRQRTLPQSAPLAALARPPRVQRAACPRRLLSARAANPAPPESWARDMWVPPDVPPISTVESLLNTLHDTVHLPWWFTMCATALVVRLVMLPIMIFSLRKQKLLVNAMPDIAAASRVFFADHKTPGLKRVLTLFRVNLAILRRHNLRPIYFFLPTISYFIAFVTVVWAFRRVIKFHPDVTHGGLAWFADLSVPDPTYGLPLAAVSLTYASLHMAFRSRAQLDPFTHTVPWIIDKWIALVQLFYIFGFPFIAALPAGVHLYWFASASLGILQMLTLRDARVRRALNIDLPIHAKARMDASRAAPQGSFKPDELLPTSERLSDQLAQASAQQAPPQSAGSDAPKGADHAADEAARTLAASASNKSSSKAP